MATILRGKFRDALKKSPELFNQVPSKIWHRLGHLPGAFNLEWNLLIENSPDAEAVRRYYYLLLLVLLFIFTLQNFIFAKDKAAKIDEFMTYCYNNGLFNGTVLVAENVNPGSTI